MNAEAIARALEGAKRSGDGWAARCPVHDDTHASLSLRDGDRGVLVKCHAGCEREAVIDELKARGVWSNGKAGKPQIIETYPYTDEHGVLLFEVVRYEPKDFRQRVPDGAGGWRWKLGNTRRVLYRLPALLAADPDALVFVTEGERDVHRLEREGLLATTNPGGAGKWRREYSEVLRGRRVVILPDMDDPGWAHAEQVARSLKGIAAAVRVVTIPGLGHKQDVSDWLTGGPLALPMLLSMAENLDTYEEFDTGAESEPISQRFHLLTVAELLAAPAPKWTVHELIPERGIGVIFGATGSGKTFAALDLACAIVRGVDWHGRGVARGSAIYVATEGRLALRLGAYLEHHALPAHALDRLRILESRISLLNGDAAELIEAIKVAALPDLRVVIVDTLNRAMPGGNENASEDMGRMVDAAAAISEAAACTCIYVHHSGKDDAKGSRGHSSLKAATDFELSVRRDGDRRSIEVEKVRDAEDGYTLTGFELVPVGDSVVLCATEAPKERAKQASMTAAERIALDALHATLKDSSKRREAPVTLLDHGAKMGQYVVLLDDWRAAIYSRLGADTSNEAKRKSFLRARERLIASHKVQVYEDHAWLP
jgi:KaiC/GvpD/RAD55 family RecA-like ATPase